MLIKEMLNMLLMLFLRSNLLRINQDTL